MNWQGTTQEVYLYLLLEFQSRVDRTMPIRLMHYVACFYDHLLKAKATTPGKGLPPVFPIVLYNGTKRWSAKHDIYDMVQPTPPVLLQPYQPHLRYYLIDEGAYTDEELAQRHSPLSGIFGIENAATSWDSLQQAVDRIVVIIQADPHKPRIDPIITCWVRRHMQWLGAGVNLETLTSLVEDKDMLAENLENLVKKERQEGREEGHQQGALEAKRNAARKLIALTDMTDQLIAEIEELPIEDVERLRAETRH